MRFYFTYAGHARVCTRHVNYQLICVIGCHDSVLESVQRAVLVIARTIKSSSSSSSSSTSWLVITTEMHNFARSSALLSTAESASVRGDGHRPRG